MSTRTCVLALACLLFLGEKAAGQLITTIDYLDTFTLGPNGRQNGISGAANIAAYAVEDTRGNPASTWTPQTNFSFNDIPGSFGAGPTVLAAATGNPGADGGVAQSGGGDFSFVYGLRSNYVVQMDAFVSPGDRTDISSVPTAGGGIGSKPSLSVFFRRDSIAGTPHPAFPVTGLPGIGIYNGSLETAVTDGAGNGVKTGVDDDNWHNLAVHFNQDARQLQIYVDGNLKADLDLTSFGGGVYQDFSNGAVGAGGAGAFVNNTVLWFDNFQVGAPGGGPAVSACFSSNPSSGSAPLAVDFDASCSLAPNAPITYTWDFGDGQAATGKTAQHTFNTADNYTVTLTVKDAADVTATTTRIIKVFQNLASFSDDFNRAPGPVDGWTPYQGDWNITPDGQLGITTTGAQEAWVWAGSPPATLNGEFEMEFELDFLANPADGVGRHAGVFFYSQNPSIRWSTSGYDIWWIDRPGDFGLSLRRWDGGAFTFLTSGTFDLIPNPPRLWRVEVDGPIIRVLGDGIPYIEVEDSTYREGFAGFWAYSNGQDARFDNLRIASSLDARLSACFTASQNSVAVGEDITFDASCSIPIPGSAITSYAWTFGDGASAADQATEHTYTATGIYTVTLTVQDAGNRTATTTREISIHGPLALPFEDNFNRAAGPVDGWSVFQGDWNIDADGKLAVATAFQEAWIWAGRPAASLDGDMVAEFDMEFRSTPPDGVGRHAGFFFYAGAPTARFQTSGYDVWWIDRPSDFGISIRRWDNGVPTFLTSGTFQEVAEPPLHWRVEVDGTLIRVFGDGVLYIEVDDATYRSGYTGFWAYLNTQDVRFDDLSITGGVTGNIRACFTVSTAGTLLAGSDITFDASCSQPALGTTLTSYEWNFGDNQTRTGKVVEHTYIGGDNYTLTLTVRDSAGGTATVQRVVRVLEPLLPFADCFDRGAGPVDGWTPYRGDWSISPAGELQTATAGAENWLWAGAPAEFIKGNLQAQLKVTFEAQPADGIGRHGGIMFYASKPTERFDAACSGYVLWWIDRVEDFGLTLARFDGNTIVPLNPGTLDAVAAPPSIWRVEVSGSRIQVFGDNVSYIDVEDNTYREGYFGIWAYANNQDIRFDDVQLGGASLPSCGGPNAPRFRRGDVDGSGVVDITDPINNLTFQFLGAFQPTCKDALDDDDSGVVDISDPIFSLSRQFLGGPPHPAPGSETCGTDPTPDQDDVGNPADLGCVSYNGGC